jgi:hypothetical protein
MTVENWSDRILYIGNHLVSTNDLLGDMPDTYTVRQGTIGLADLAFFGDSTLKSIELNEGLIYIGKAAFSGCTELEGITIPDSVTSIGDSAFYNCSSLTSITIPDSVTSIGRRAFSNCSKLTNVTIGFGITSLDEWTFSDCTNLDTVVIRAVDPTIKRYAFGGCTNLSTVYTLLPHHVWALDGVATGNEALTNARNYVYSEVRPETQGDYWHYVNGKITLWAHSGCVGNYRVSTIQPTCEEDGYTVHTCTACGDSYVTDETPAFGHTWSDWLVDIQPSCKTGRQKKYCFRCHTTMYEKVPATGEHSFSKSVIESPTCIDDGYSVHTCRICGESYETTEKALGHTWGSWKHIWSEDPSYAPRKRTCSVCGEEEIRIADFILCELDGVTYSIKAFDITTTPSEVVIPSSFNGKAITRIESNAFAGCKTITKVTIPASITDIEALAFYECTNLTTVEFEEGSNLVSIGDFAFGKCENLTNITIPDGCTTIRQFAFSGCTKLNVVVIPPSLSNMGNGAFHLSDDLTVRIEQEKRPEGWDESWCDSNTNIEWTEADENTEPCTHTWLDWYVETEPLCDFTGTVKRVCSTCGNVEYKEIDSLGHISSDWIIDTEATETAEGSKHKECTRCGVVLETATIPMLGTTNTYLVTESGEYLTDEQGNLLIL